MATYKPHLLVDVIKAWADGVSVQSMNEDGSWETWMTPPNKGTPMFGRGLWRVKPLSERAPIINGDNCG